MATLAELLATDAPSFDFFALVDRLAGQAALPGTAPVRFASSPATTFPAADIAGCSVEHDGVRLALAFMGLTGASSPLPVSFVEEALAAEGEPSPLADFLAIFENRTYALFYEAWRSCRLLRCTSAVADGALAAIAGLAGCDPAGLADPSQRRLLACAGALCGPARSAAGLEALLAALLGGLPIEVVERIAHWVRLEGLAPLGGGCRLGSNAVAGDTVCDLDGAFRVVVGPLRRGEYERFLDDTRVVADAARVTRRYLAEPLDFEIEVCIAAGETHAVRLGDGKAGLGRSATLGSSGNVSPVTVWRTWDEPR
jgi:type VI secretion system protein ImpH